MLERRGYMMPKLKARSAATSTPPWASSALTQPRYFSTRATRVMMRRLEQRIRKQERAAGSMHGWRIAHLKANHRLDLLKSDMRGDQLKVTAHMYRGTCSSYLPVHTR
uniref:Uncharacterized protein n=1 Tax=Oryza rufipogon TaxID=4529 RepID=A0A0E0Q465_ORYRU